MQQYYNENKYKYFLKFDRLTFKSEKVSIARGKIINNKSFGKKFKVLLRLTISKYSFRILCPFNTK